MGGVEIKIFVSPKNKIGSADLELPICISVHIRFDFLTSNYVAAECISETVCC